MEHPNRRRLERRNLLFNLEVRRRDTGELLGHIGDLHARGLSILQPAAAPLTVGTTLWVSVATPALATESARVLVLEVVVRWCRPDDNPDLVSVGCELVSTSHATIDAIEGVIERFELSG